MSVIITEMDFFAAPSLHPPTTRQRSHTPSPSAVPRCRRVLVSEEAYLDFSTTLLPGHKVLPAITGQARKTLNAVASAPVLPKIVKEVEEKGPTGPPVRLTRKFSSNQLGEGSYKPLPLG